MEAKRCATCGAEFGCGRRDPDCWCSALPALSAARLEPALDCLCPRCLAHASASIDSRTGALDGGTADPDPAA